MATSTLASADYSRHKFSGNIGKSSSITIVSIIIIVTTTFALANGSSVHFAFITLLSLHLSSAQRTARSLPLTIIWLCMHTSLCMHVLICLACVRVYARGFVAAATRLVIGIIVIINWVTFQWWMAWQKQCS